MPPTDSRLRSLGRAGALAANVLPLVGVLAWGWDLAALLVLYGVEGVVTAAVAAPKALFAEQRPGVPLGAADFPLRELRDKRGGVRLRAGWPPVYPRNLPFALGLAGGFLFAWTAVVALVLADFAGAALDSLSASVALSALAVAAARVGEFRTEYLGEGEYADVSARTAASTPARQLLLVLCLLPLLGAAGESRAAGTALLVVVVAAKTLSDAYDVWVDHLGREPLRVGEWLFGVPDTGEPPPAVDPPETPPSASVETDTSAVLFTGLIPVALAFATRPGLVLLLLSMLAVLAFGGWALLPAAGAVGIVVAASLLAHYVRYGTLEYRRRGDALVCRDAWLDEPQWTCDLDAVRDCSVDRRVTSRLFGTSVVRFEDGAGDAYRLGPVSDVDDAVERLGLPAFDTDQSEPDRAVAVAAVALAGFFVAIPAGLYLAPGVSTGEAVGVSVLLVPGMAMVVGPLLWVSLYNA